MQPGNVEMLPSPTRAGSRASRVVGHQALQGVDGLGMDLLGRGFLLGILQGQGAVGLHLSQGKPLLGELKPASNFSAGSIPPVLPPVVLPA